MKNLLQSMLATRIGCSIGATIKPLSAILLISAILIGFGGLALLASNPSLLASPDQQPKEVLGGSINLRVTPEEKIAAGARSVLIVEATQHDVNATRGSVVTVALQITDRPGTNPHPSVTLELTGIGGLLAPPSVANRLTERDKEAMSQGRKVPGVIELSPLVRFEPNSVTLSPGETKSVQMHITIPQDWPDELVGRQAVFSPTFRVPQAVEFNEVGVEGTYVAVHVVG